MKQQIGFIGAGNMGMAIINGLIASKIVKPNQIAIFNKHQDKVKQLSKEIGIQAAESAEQLAKTADIVVIGVKPNVVPSVLASIKSSLTKKTLIVSIAAGVTIESMEAIVGTDHKIIRVMPNTPSLVREGVSSLSENNNVTASELKTVVTMFESLGLAQVVPESLIHAVVGVSGSAPAYVFMFIEAMADAAVLAGMPRAQAYQFAAQAVLGSAKMVLETGKHPGELKDMVCSPGGTTIEAVKTLEDKGFRAAVIEAMTSCINKSKSLSGE